MEAPVHAIIPLKDAEAAMDSSTSRTESKHALSQQDYLQKDNPWCSCCVIDRFYNKLTITVFVAFVLTSVSTQMVLILLANFNSPTLTAFFCGMLFGLFKSPALNGAITASIARLESLPYNYVWDYLIFEVHSFILMVVPILQTFRYYANHQGGTVLVISIFLDSGVMHMFASVVPSLIYYWMHPEVGTRQCLYDWQKSIPWHGFMVQKVFRSFKTSLRKRAARGTWFGSRPWGPPSYADQFEPLTDEPPML